MALKDTSKELRSLINSISGDLDKAENGNKAAAQRVRTCSIRFEKVAKLFRKESIKSEKTGGFKKKKPAAPKKAAKKAAPAKAKAAPAKAKKAKAKPKAVAKKKPTAKLIRKHK